MIANCNWQRPIYVATTVGRENYMNLGQHFVREGLANRITPFLTDPGERFKREYDSEDKNPSFDTEKTYDRMMNKFKYGGLEKKDLYLDETVRRMCDTHRALFVELAIRLIYEGKFDKAKKVLAKMETVLPEYNVPISFSNQGDLLIEAYGRIGNKKRATEIADKLWKNSVEWLEWYLSQGDNYILANLLGPNLNCPKNQLLDERYGLYAILGAMESIDEKWYNAHATQYNTYYQMFAPYFNSLKQNDNSEPMNY